MRFISPYIEAVARDFWDSTNQIWSLPYDISGATSLSLPIDIVSLSELSLNKIKNWLVDKKIKISIEISDRSLHGFILIFKGCGFIFINGTDSEADRRYTIAHEVSHFILDYKLPRDKAIKKFGISIKDLLDGLREPSSQERIDGLIHDVSVQPFTHLLEKEGDGSFENVQVYSSENNADALAFELLAPNSKVIKDTLSGHKKLQFDSFDKRCRDILLTKYKLPSLIAEQYSKKLAYSVTGGPSLMTKLGFDVEL